MGPLLVPFFVFITLAGGKEIGGDRSYSVYSVRALIVFFFPFFATLYVYIYVLCLLIM